MSQNYGEGAPTTTGAEGQPSGTVETAKQDAMAVKDTAVEQTADVVETAKSEAGAVAHEAKDQAKQLYAQTRSELTEQAALQQQRVAEGLRSIGGELGTMAGNAEGGVAADLVQQVSQRVEGVASWIGDRNPGTLLSDVKSYARAKPGMFIGAAVLAGLVAGRLTRALTEGAAEDAAAAKSPSGGAVSVGDTSGASSSAGVGSAAGVIGSPPVVEPWQGNPPVDPTVPAAPDGISGHDVGTDASGESGDTPLFDQTGAASHSSFETDRP